MMMMVAVARNKQGGFTHGRANRVITLIVWMSTSNMVWMLLMLLLMMMS